MSSCCNGPQPLYFVWSSKTAGDFNVQQITLSIADACVALSLSRSSIYKLINSGRLRTLKIGSRTLVTAESIQALVDGGAA